MQTKTVINNCYSRTYGISPLLRIALAFVLLTMATLIYTTTVYADTAAVYAETKEQEKTPTFTINSLTTKLIDNVFLADLEQEFHLNKVVIEALTNGVPITLRTEFTIYTDNWYWNKTLANISQRFKVSYHALSQQYILTNINTGKQISYSNLYRVLYELKKLNSLPLIDKNLLPTDSEIFIKVRNRLEIESLPLPLKATAYLSSNWRLKSDWATWLLTE